MIIDLQESTEKFFEYDICIVGSGISGSIISREIIEEKNNLKVCILEGGNFLKNSFTNNGIKDLIYKKLNIKPNSREFIVGGSSTTWGGVSTHYTEFEMKDINNQSNLWPINYEELLCFYRKASKKYNFFNTYDFKDESFDLFKEFELRYFFSNYPPLNFKIFIDTLQHDLIFNSRVISIKQVDNDIKYLIASTSKNKTARIFAKYFIFSCGTLETIKILLNNIKENSLRLGEEKENIGLYFMNHPKCISGRVKLFNANKEIERFTPVVSKRGSGYWGLSLPKNSNKDQLNSYIIFSFDNPYIFKYFLKPLIKNFLIFISNPFKYRLKMFSFKQLPIQLLESDYKEHINIEKDYKEISFFRSYLKNILPILKFLKKIFYNRDLKVHNYIEMKPNKKNRVYLNSNKDLFNKNLLTIDYDLSKEDLSSINLLHKKVDDCLLKNKIGTLESIPFEDLQKNIFNDSSHHLGGLIMGKSPSDSVVNENLKIHSLNNIYLISGGVFPTSGSGNPTWTIAALSIRLAENIIKKF